MKDTELLHMALGLAAPWQVISVEFDASQKRLDINLGFSKGSTFCCPGCSQENQKSHDTIKKTWRHLDFFEHEAYLSAKVPRVKCERCGVHLVTVPWARAGSGFTLLYEAMVMTLSKWMPVKNIGAFSGEHDTRLWRVLHHYVNEARANQLHENVRHVGVDETSAKRGHDYVSVFVDLEQPAVLFATEGKDASTVKRFKQDLVEHQGKAENITEICSDMSPAFIKGTRKNFPDAELTFDKFHIMKVLGDAVDEVRRAERKDRPELNRTRYIWLKNPKNLKKSELKKLEEMQIQNLNLETMRAYHIRLNFAELFQQPLCKAEAFFNEWYNWASRSGLKPIERAAKTLKEHMRGILRWFTSGINNGILEGINSLIQSAKSRARGYRTKRCLITMIYIIAGKLEFNLPT